MPIAVLLEHQRAHGHRDLEVGSGLTGPVRSLTVLTAACFEIGVVAEVDERVLCGDGGDIDRATTAAVAAIRSAAGNVLLSPETEAAVAARTGGHVDVDFVDEHKGFRNLESGFRTALIPESRFLIPIYSTGRTEILRPCWPWSSKRTLPSILANSV